MIRYLDSHYLFNAAGDIIELNAWVPDDIIEQIDALNADETKWVNSRISDDHSGTKGGYEYNHVPEGWSIPDHTVELGSLLYNKGDFLYPHRDKWRGIKEDGSIHGDSFRLICHINHTNPREFCFLYEDKVFVPEPKRWYIVNTQKVHYGFSFVDGVYHLSAGLHLNTEETRTKTTKWLLDVLPFAQPDSDRKGVDCARN